MSVAKAAGAAAVVVGVAGTGYGVSEYLRKPYTLSNFLSSDKGKDKKAEYDHQLGGVTGNGDILVANIAENEKWWKSRFDSLNLESIDKSTAFNSVTTYSADTSSRTAINKLCDDAYKKHVSEFSEVTNVDKSKYKKNVELFCTVSGKEGSVVLGIKGIPTTLKGQSGYSETTNNTKYGYKHADQLISTVADRNRGFWEERVKKLVSGDSVTFVSGGFFENNFKTAFDAYKAETKDVDKPSKLTSAVEKLKEGCKAKYGHTDAINSSDQEKWTEFWKFCSVEGKLPDNWKPK
ncbi:hypothetical protein [Candidatus Mycoplasma haematohominis]|uniref:hypothetical protein n=1 Tax=Candidatus Mycoplasma haematohominis TaxID=1494318 RepID=UPI001C0A7081|nr:hypothetical protein [Candidatus Mycoplasma haemohominis]